MPTLGQAYVQIVPSADGISNSISDVLSGPADKAGQDAGSTFGSSFGSKLKSGMLMAGAGIAAFGAATGVALGKSISDVSKYGDHVDKMSQKIGFSAAGFQNQQDQNRTKDDIQLGGITAALGQSVQRCDNVHIDTDSCQSHDPVIDGDLMSIALFELKTNKAQEEAKGQGCHTLDHRREQAEHGGIDLENGPQDTNCSDHLLDPRRKLLQAIAGFDFEFVEVNIHDLVFFLFKDTHDLPPIFSWETAQE